jgi:hypothetical protein
VRAALGVLSLLAVLVACRDLRVKEGIYANVAEARAAGAISSGWVPEAVPPGATDLREGHTPDGRHWGVFAFAQRDADAVRALVGQEIADGTLTCDPPGRLEWWPRVLLSPVNVANVRSTGFRLYRASSGPRTFAINWGQGRAYYWRE